MKEIGSLIGVTVSGSFLLLIGVLNLVVLLGIVGVWRQAAQGSHSHHHLDELLMKRGLMNRLFGNRLSKAINHSWQLYPLGVLFGLGFDTASEVALLAMTAGAAAGNLPTCKTPRNCWPVGPIGIAPLRNPGRGSSRSAFTNAASTKRCWPWNSSKAGAAIHRPGPTCGRSSCNSREN